MRSISTYDCVQIWKCFAHKHTSWTYEVRLCANWSLYETYYALNWAAYDKIKFSASDFGLTKGEGANQLGILINATFLLKLIFAIY